MAAGASVLIESISGALLDGRSFVDALPVLFMFPLLCSCDAWFILPWFVLRRLILPLLVQTFPFDFCRAGMKRIETIQAFYDHRQIGLKPDKQFNVFENGDYCKEPLVYNRRDFYKVALLLGKCRLSWQGEEMLINRPALVCYNPQIPYAWTPLEDEQPGYFCLFSAEFIQDKRNESLKHFPLFNTGAAPVVFLNKKALKTVEALFRQMLEEMAADYAFKYELLRSQLQMLIHLWLKQQPPITNTAQQNAAARITASFLHLLERQFPIDTPERSVSIRTAGDFAQKLSVHVNHLNDMVKQVTGKPTSTHIADRIIVEAKALLKHSDWPIDAIAYSLGFSYPNHFYNFLKKKTGQSPKQLRMAVL